MIPLDVKQQLDAYAQHHIPLGGFLAAVVSNNLEIAVGKADECNYANLRAIVQYAYNLLPMASRGSPEAYHAWIKRTGHLIIEYHDIPR